MNKAPEQFDVTGRVAIVTGGAGLIGREYVRALSDAGARVAIADKDVAAATRVATDVGKSGAAEPLVIETDVASKESVEAMVSRVAAELGGVDILVNNAAIDPKFDRQHAGGHTSSFEDFPLDLWNESLAVNLTGMFLCAQTVARPMLDRGQGVIVNISSTYGLVSPDQRIYESEGRPPSYKPVAYSVTKSGVIGLTRYLATYWAAKNIRVNTLTPGGVLNNHDDEFVRRYSMKTPLGRMAHSNEYCAALLFLVSDASSYMTGANLVVDGGWTAW